MALPPPLQHQPDNEAPAPLEALIRCDPSTVAGVMVVIGTSPLALLCQMCVSGSSCSPSASPERHRRPRDPFSTRPHVLHQTPIWSGPAAHFSFRCVTCFHPAPNPSLSIHNSSCLWMCLCSPRLFPPPGQSHPSTQPHQAPQHWRFPSQQPGTPLPQPGQGYPFLPLLRG